MELPAPAQEALKQTASDIPAIATQCFMLSNMFDPSKVSMLDSFLDYLFLKFDLLFLLCNLLILGD